MFPYPFSTINIILPENNINNINSDFDDNFMQRIQMFLDKKKEGLNFNDRVCTFIYICIFICVFVDRWCRTMSIFANAEEKPTVIISNTIINAYYIYIYAQTHTCIYIHTHAQNVQAYEYAHIESVSHTYIYTNER